MIRKYGLHLIFATIVSLGFGIANADDCDDNDTVEPTNKGWAPVTWVDVDKEMKRIAMKRKVQAMISEMNSNPNFINMIAENNAQLEGIAK